MKHHTEAQVTVHYNSQPIGWVTNLGDSGTNNGNCGDEGTNTFDAELCVIQPPAPPHHEPFDHDVEVCTNVFGDGGNEFHDLLAEDPLTETVLTFVIRDQYLHVSSSASPRVAEFSGEGMFRIDTGVWDSEAEACNDGKLWLGLNRVVDGTYRWGQGARFAEITLIGRGPAPDRQEE